MKNINFINLSFFIIFFGIALIEAIKNKDWIQSALFLALGLLSLKADLKKNN